MKIKQEVFELLKSWCDKIVETAIDKPDNPYLDGAAVCPACAVVHGRFADMVLPLILLYKETGEEKYLTFAKKAIRWTERNMLCADGMYRNDMSNTWKGVTAFFAMSLGETLYRFGDILDSDTRREWHDIFIARTDAVAHFFETVQTHTNYYAGISALFALAYRYTNDEKYRVLAIRWERFCREHIDADGLIFGEGMPRARVTDKGCRAIDMGYNLEETVPLLILHSKWLQDEEKLKFYTNITLKHLEFMLPDGGIDNSFGTRANKWTYWGSRTGDGMQEGLVYIADRHPAIARAALMNFRLLESCTEDGSLYGGTMQSAAGEPACIHHAFPHAKALAIFYLEAGECFDNCEEAVLPRQKQGIRSYQNGNLYTVTKGDFIATVNACDFVQYKDSESSGGALTMLWHKSYGPMVASTVHKLFMAEPLNMQYQRNANSEICQTARIVDGSYTSDNDLTVSLAQSANSIIAKSEKYPFKIKYDFSGNNIKIFITVQKQAQYILPIISKIGDNVVDTPTAICFKDILTVSSNSSHCLAPESQARYFHPASGFQYKQIIFSLKAGETTQITIECK